LEVLTASLCKAGWLDGTAWRAVSLWRMPFAAPPKTAAIQRQLWARRENLDAFAAALPAGTCGMRVKT